jgi:hypothetical protein
MMGKADAVVLCALWLDPGKVPTVFRESEMH